MRFFEIFDIDPRVFMCLLVALVAANRSWHDHPESAPSTAQYAFGMLLLGAAGGAWDSWRHFRVE